MKNSLTCYTKDPSMVFRNIGGEVMLIPVRRNVADLENIYIMNEVAAFIWEHIDGKTSVNDLMGKVLKEFEVEHEEAGPDITVFFQQLEEIKALRG